MLTSQALTGLPFSVLQPPTLTSQSDEFPHQFDPTTETKGTGHKQTFQLNGIKKIKPAVNFGLFVICLPTYTVLGANLPIQNVTLSSVDVVIKHQDFAKINIYTTYLLLHTRGILTIGFK